MSTRKLIVLGTSAQVPTRDRNHSGYFLYWDQAGFLIDPGEGTQRQLTSFNVRASSITKILLTHFHGDHCLGLPGVIQRLSLDNVKHTVEVYFPSSGQGFFERLLGTSFHAGHLDLHPCPISQEGVIYNDSFLAIEAYRLNHPVETFGYRIKEHDSVTLLQEKLNEFGLKGAEIGRLKETGTIRSNEKMISLEQVSIPKVGQCIAFVMDTAECDNAIRLASGADLLVCESTFGSEHHDLAVAYGHLTAEQAALIAVKSGARHLVLTHFSQRYLDTGNLLTEAKRLHSLTSAANDGDVFELPIRKKEMC
jgi:ribonuclease Z